VVLNFEIVSQHSALATLATFITIAFAGGAALLVIAVLQGRRIHIANNLILDVGTDYSGFFLQTASADSVTVEHNTVQHAGNMIVTYGDPTTNFIFRNNILQHNQYGVVCEGGPRACFRPGTFKGNVIADNNNAAASGYPIDNNFSPGNFFPPFFTHIKFVDYTRGDWRLAAESRFKGKATHGKDPGVDFTTLPVSEEALRLGRKK